ncbi:DUF896 domain-containing protein [Virgibacillus sp. NKC19-3]|uniref:DUF896 domain-containing protein n=1 Tax=Virgibacillus saliphilus TaxID=2831674 RepID=UPI001C9AFEF4|nr:DUF896 domain-containing protein [Virgibacillus sp. NKC19-3]MBY7143579.1 DUF896 domain-containing protein [Virgibacillus sp. NKC19-3]
MLSKEKIERINQLSKKSKLDGLTDKEKAEQSALRKEYLANVRHSFKNEFKSMKVIDPEGNDVTPEKVRDLQARNKKH